MTGLFGYPGAVGIQRATKIFYEGRKKLLAGGSRGSFQNYTQRCIFVYITQRWEIVLGHMETKIRYCWVFSERE